MFVESWSWSNEAILNTKQSFIAVELTFFEKKMPNFWRIGCNFKIKFGFSTIEFTVDVEVLTHYAGFRIATSSEEDNFLFLQMFHSMLIIFAPKWLLIFFFLNFWSYLIKKLNFLNKVLSRSFMAIQPVLMLQKLIVLMVSAKAVEKWSICPRITVPHYSRSYKTRVKINY